MKSKKKIALITGGSRGLGKNMALALAQNGMDTVLTYYNEKGEANEVMKEITRIGAKAATLQLDLTQFEKLDAFTSEFQDILKDRWGVEGFEKSALETFTRHVAQEYGHRGIRSVAIAPGAIATDFNNAQVRNNEAVKQKLASMTALGRVGEPGDIGGVVAFLCSDAAQWINGERIEVTGGQSL